jgi:hypothetical protein
MSFAYLKENEQIYIFLVQCVMTLFAPFSVGGGDQCQIIQFSLSLHFIRRQIPALEDNFTLPWCVAVYCVLVSVTSPDDG